MYKIAKEAREKMKAKARSLAGEKDQKVDSSDWIPAEPLNTEAKTGMRPISPRNYKKGGKVVGKAAGAASKARADRKARKAGGAVEKEIGVGMANKNMKEANKSREGVKHIGGLKHGGEVPSDKETQTDKARIGTEKIKPVRGAAQHYKKGGKADHPDVAEDKSLIKKMVKKEALTGKAEGGGKWIQKAIKHKGALHKQLGVPAGEKIPAKKLHAAAEKGGKLGKRARLAETLGRLGKAWGGGLTGEKKSKGRKNKHFPEISIKIETSKSNQPLSDMGIPMGAGMPAPVGAPAAPPMGAAGPAPTPPGMAPGAPPPGGVPGMPFKSGGRVGKFNGGPMMGAPVAAPPVAVMPGPGSTPTGSFGPAPSAVPTGSFGPAPAPMPPGVSQLPPSVGPGIMRPPMGGPQVPPMGGGVTPTGFHPITGQPMGGPIGSPPVSRMPGGIGAPGVIPRRRPMPGPMPAPGPVGGPITGVPLMRKSGGRITKVAKSYKDMEAGAASGEGRLQKTDIAKLRKDAPARKSGGKVRGK